jgi:hypothetical protein
MDSNKEKDDLWCNYSNLPSPLFYAECADYDSMGNHGRFPVQSKNKEKKPKTLLSKLKRKKK